MPDDGDKCRVDTYHFTANHCFCNDSIGASIESLYSSASIASPSNGFENHADELVSILWMTQAHLEGLNAR